MDEIWHHKKKKSGSSAIDFNKDVISSKCSDMQSSKETEDHSFFKLHDFESE